MARTKAATMALANASVAKKKAPKKKVAPASKVQPRRRGKRKPVQISMDLKLLERLDKWCAQQTVPPDRSATVQAMITEWLDRRGG